MVLWITMKQDEDYHYIKRLEYPFSYPHPFVFRYPKFTFLFLTIILAYFFLTGANFIHVREQILSLGYVGTFIAGMMFAYGFTAVPGTAIFILLAKTQNIYIAALIGGLGGLFADLLIFNFVRHSFKDEIEELSQEKFFIHLASLIPKKLKKTIIIGIAALAIASPLPDEIAVVLLASYREISTRLFSEISYVLNTLGILFVLFVGTML